MNEIEYKAIQDDLSRLISPERMGRIIHPGYAESYKKAVLSCKSVISYYNPNKKHCEDNMSESEYEAIQDDLSKLITPERMSRITHSGYAETYKEAVQYCKSVVSNHNPNK